jgi:hypothetical protein
LQGHFLLALSNRQPGAELGTHRSQKL